MGMDAQVETEKTANRNRSQIYFSKDKHTSLTDNTRSHRLSEFIKVYFIWLHRFHI